MTSNNKPAYCLTIGDPSGIGPEITARLLQNEDLRKKYHFVVIGNIPSLERTAEQLQISLPSIYGSTEFINISGDVNKEPGAISYMALDKAVEIIKGGQVRGLVTGPISKENLYKSGIRFSGHTEILEYMAEKYYRKQFRADMLFVYRAFRMLLLTRHIPLRQVSDAITRDGVVNALTNLLAFLKERQRLASPRICILGVNPHAGELEGNEERNVLIPAIQAVSKAHNLYIEPPFAADALFRGFDIEQVPYDAYVAAYHDQGLIPFKLVAGLRAVNVTIGLPFLRTSVSHGMASDIVGKGVADPSSLIEAVQVADELA